MKFQLRNMLLIQAFIELIFFLLWMCSNCVKFLFAPYWPTWPCLEFVWLQCVNGLGFSHRFTHCLHLLAKDNFQRLKRFIENSTLFSIFRSTFLISVQRSLNGPPVFHASCAQFSLLQTVRWIIMLSP